MKKNNGESLEALEARYRENPEGTVFARLAETLLRSGDVTRAEQLCQDGLKRYPGYTTGRLVLGRCYMAQARFDDASAEFQRVCRTDRRSPSALKYLADSLARRQYGDRAGGIYAYLLESDPDNVDLQYLSASVPGRYPEDVLDVAGISGALVEPHGPPVAHAEPEPRHAPAEAAPESVMPAKTVDLPTPTVNQPTVKPPAKPAELRSFIQSGETIALAPGGEPGVSATDITGQDVSYRIDALFGGDEQSVQGPIDTDAPSPAPDHDPLTELFAMGQLDDVAHLDTGRFAISELDEPQEPPQAHVPEGETFAEVPGDFDDSFGATMIIDQGTLDTPEEPKAESDEATAVRPIEEFLVADGDEDESAYDSDTDEATLSGTDVSSRLDEMFDLAWPESESAPEPKPVAGLPETPHEPISAIRSSDIQTAITEEAVFPEEFAQERPLDSNTAELTDQTAVFEETAVHDALRQSEPAVDDTVYEFSSGSDHGSAEQAADGEPTDMFQAAALGPAPSPTIGEEHSEDLGAGFAHDFAPPPPDTSEFSLDQEMAFGERETSLSDLMEVPVARLGPASSEDSPGSLFTSDDSIGFGGQDVSDEITSVFTRPKRTEPQDDLFAASPTGDSSPPKGEPQTKQERTEEAQTLEFARDELETLVALGGERLPDERLGDTTTITTLDVLKGKNASVEDEPVDLEDVATLAMDTPGAEKDSGAERGFQEVRFEAPAEPPAMDATEMAEPQAAETVAAPAAEQPQAEEPRSHNPFEAYASEISKAQTLLFRRKDLERFAGVQRKEPVEERADDEKAELDEQVSRAHTVEFRRDDLLQMTGRGEQPAEHPLVQPRRPAAAPTPPPPVQRAPAPRPAAPAAREPARASTPPAPPRGHQTPAGFVDTSMVFLDEVGVADVRREPGQPRTPSARPDIVNPFSDTMETVPSDAMALNETVVTQASAPEPEPPPRAEPKPKRAPMSPFAFDPFAADADVGVPEPPSRPSQAPPVSPVAQSHAVLEEGFDAPATRAETPRSARRDAGQLSGTRTDHERSAADGPAAAGPGDTVAERRRPPRSALEETIREMRPLLSDEPPSVGTEDTVVMDKPGALAAPELVWEEQDGPRIDLVVGTGGVAPKGDFADTVVMSEADIQMPPGRLPESEPPARKDLPAAAVAPSRRAADVDAAPRQSPRLDKRDESPGVESDEVSDSQIAAIPDHVLTPTLADIYYRQGQPNLAVQIYRRLLQIDPDNERISGRLAEIEESLARANAAQAAGASAQAAPPGASQADESGTPVDERPSRVRRSLAGVKIKKEYRDGHRQKRTRRT